MTRDPKDIPIIFSGPMVRAIDDDLKTKTRRIAYQARRGFEGRKNPLIDGTWTRIQPGDRLWVRENAKLRSIGPAPGEVSIMYQADADQMSADIVDRFIKPEQKNPLKLTGWTPSIHLPRWASRLTLIVTATKREPLQAISIADAIAEGIPATAPIGAFADLWRKLHGPKSWDENPEVVAISFRTIKANIDSEEAREAA